MNNSCFKIEIEMRNQPFKIQNFNYVQIYFTRFDSDFKFWNNKTKPRLTFRRG